MIIFKNSADLAAGAAAHVVQAACQAIQARGRFTLALAGGKTPLELYRLLASAPIANEIDWHSTFLFMGDERQVPFEDDRSNFGMVREVLLPHISIPAENIFPCPVEGTAKEGAEQYERILASFFGATRQDEPPAFDLMLLGLGDDGHTASLFPHQPSLDVDTAWVVSSPPGALPPPVERVTFTFPLINAAREALFLVVGSNKAEAVREILDQKADFHERPAAGVRLTAGKLTWMLDKQAASLLA